MINANMSPVKTYTNPGNFSADTFCDFACDKYTDFLTEYLNTNRIIKKENGKEVIYTQICLYDEMLMHLKHNSKNEALLQEFRAKLGAEGEFRKSLMRDIIPTFSKTSSGPVPNEEFFEAIYKNFQNTKNNETRDMICEQFMDACMSMAKSLEKANPENQNNGISVNA